MEPQEVRAKVHAAYARAIASSVTSWSGDDHLAHLFRDLKLYGHEAGVDFVNTHSNAIVQALIEAAGRRKALLQIQIYGFGHAALDGMTDTLRVVTALTTYRENSTITVAWADTSPRML